MFDKEFLEDIVHKVISGYVENEVSGDSDELIHMDYDVLSISAPRLVEGRSGSFVKFSFEYALKVVSSNQLEGDELIRYRQSVRMTEEGQLTGVSEKIELD